MNDDALGQAELDWDSAGVKVGGADWSRSPVWDALDDLIEMTCDTTRYRIRRGYEHAHELLEMRFAALRELLEMRFAALRELAESE